MFSTALIVVFAIGLVLCIVARPFVTVEQASVAVMTMFGKYRRILGPGLHLKIPVLERVYSRVPVQNQSAELSFQATTADQAGVNFSAMLLYTVSDASEATITKVAFKFVSDDAFMKALVRSIEGTIRSFVATKRQAEILGLRTEIVEHVKAELDNQLADWGYHLLDLQINDISFGAGITQSMERVVASQNERTAAENEGAALLIRETKRAEAEGAAIKIAAAAEMEAARLRGQGVAAFRQEVATGMAEAARATEAAGLDPAFVLFAMWTESVRHVAENGRGNLITLDGSPAGMEATWRQMMALAQVGPAPMRVVVPADDETGIEVGPEPTTGGSRGTAADPAAVVEPTGTLDPRYGPPAGGVAGWYPDPWQQAAQRHFDGVRWTGRTR